MNFSKKEYQEAIKSRVRFFKRFWTGFESMDNELIKIALSEDFMNYKKDELISFQQKFTNYCNKAFYKWCNETPNELKPWNC